MKVAIIGGGGRVGSCAAFALQCSGIVRELVLLDANQATAEGEALDLLHGAAYCAAKAGMDHFSRCVALEEALRPNGAKVCSLAPGVIATDMTGGVKAKYDQLIIENERGITPIRRWGRPEDIGRAVRAIAEDRFPFSTGAVFDVDGGFHLHRL